MFVAHTKEEELRSVFLALATHFAHFSLIGNSVLSFFSLFCGQNQNKGNGFFIVNQSRTVSIFFSQFSRFLQQLDHHEKTNMIKRQNLRLFFSYVFIFHTIFIKYVFSSSFIVLILEEGKKHFFFVVENTSSKKIIVFAAEKCSNVLLAQRQNYKYTPLNIFVFRNTKTKKNWMKFPVIKKLEWRKKHSLASVCSQFFFLSWSFSSLVAIVPVNKSHCSTRALNAYVVV